MNSDLEKLIQAAVYEGQTSGVDALTAALTASVAPLNSSRGAESGPEAIAIGAKQLVDAATSAALNTEGLSRKPSNSASSQERGLGETALRTAAMMTGVGPLVTGLMKLFGSDDPEPLPPLEKFSAPG
ncbi:MAG TPA: hypothetical protein VER03_06145, partial [Bryobacteraceae bacterium]|nr:hypothetical protein [Bryobacteraceae bacterium]